MTRGPSEHPGGSVTEWHENFVGAISSLARVSLAGSVVRVGGVTIARSGLATPAFNCAFGLDRPRTLDGVAETIEREFVRTRIPWRLVTTLDSAEAFEPVIRRLDLLRRERIPGMVLTELPDRAPSLPDGLGIELMRSPADARSFGRLLMEGFEGPPDLLHDWADGLTRSSSPGKQGARYIGYLHNSGVCTAVRYDTGRIIGIYGVSTLPKFRGRGYGTAVTLRALADGRASGGSEGYLQTSPMGRRVYEAIGFRVVEEYLEWGPADEPPEAAGDETRPPRPAAGGDPGGHG